MHLFILMIPSTLSSLCSNFGRLSLTFALLSSRDHHQTTPPTTRCLACLPNKQRVTQKSSFNLKGQEIYLYLDSVEKCQCQGGNFHFFQSAAHGSIMFPPLNSSPIEIEEEVPQLTVRRKNSSVVASHVSSTLLLSERGLPLESIGLQFESH